MKNVDENLIVNRSKMAELNDNICKKLKVKTHVYPMLNHPIKYFIKKINEKRESTAIGQEIIITSEDDDEFTKYSFNYKNDNINDIPHSNKIEEEVKDNTLNNINSENPLKDIKLSQSNYNEETIQSLIDKNSKGPIKIKLSKEYIVYLSSNILYLS